jgi:site-specific DNA-methyltransferase (adenine-specific)
MNTIDFIVGNAKKMPVSDSSVNLIVTEIPMYIGYNKENKEYVGFEKSAKKYVESLVQVTKEMERVLSPSGSIFICFPNNNDMPYNFLSLILEKTDLLLANPPFIWNHSDPNEQPQPGFIRFSYDFVFHFIKSPQLIYSNPYAVKKYSKPIWDLPWFDETDRVMDKMKSVGFDGNSFRKDIPKRLIEMFSRENDLVLDPFGGSGTTACEAYFMNRRAISLDSSEEQNEFAKIRLDLMKDEKK